MRFALALLSALSVAAIYDPLAPTGAEIIEGEYIVVLHPTVKMDTHMSLMASLVNETNTMHTYSIGSFQGYAAKISKEEAKTLATHRDVKYIEPNMVARVQQECTQFPPPANAAGGLWGLARTVRPGRVTDGGPIGSANYEMASRASGADIDIYVIDTGVYCANVDFSGRSCTVAFDSTNEGLFDGNGHGTHVASSAAGNTYGLARRANIIGVKVLGSNGSGSFAGVVAGINFTARAAPGRRVVGNMSLGGGANQATDDATNAAVAAGVLMAVAAGNNNANACNFSPARARDAFTVMSTANNDGRSSFSNFGTCGNVFAPGTNIMAAWIGGTTATRTISGTSMASPHVAGVAAKIWSANPSLTNIGVQNALLGFANRDVVTNPGAGSVNLLALQTCAQSS